MQEPRCEINHDEYNTLSVVCITIMFCFDSLHSDVYVKGGGTHDRHVKDGCSSH